MIYLDLETRSRVDLTKSGVYAYSEGEDFAVLMLAFAIDDEPVHVVTGDDIAVVALNLVYSGDALVAHNAPFDRVALGAFLGQHLDPAQWVDTRVIAALNGYPGKLSDLAKALGVEEKDSAGTRLINLFSKPNRQGDWNDATTHPEQWAEFVEYARQDVETLRQVHRALPPMDEREARISEVDQRINDCGIRVDVELAKAAQVAGTRSAKRALSDIADLTGVANPNSVQQLMGWFGDLPDLRAETVAQRLTFETGDRRRVLQLRQEVSLASHKKFNAALSHVSADGRLRGAFWMYGAHTGRWSGRGVQLQNLPRLSLGDGEAEAIARVKAGGDASPDELKALVRPLLLGPLTVCDYSAIEARVIAWLAGEDWALEAFREGRDLYVETAERMSSRTKKLTRQEGKVAVLACSYGGSVGAMSRMGGADLGDENYLRHIVQRWRDANPAIVQLWWNLKRAMMRGGKVGRITIEVPDRSIRRVVLPSGRALTYRGIRIGRDEYDRPEVIWHSSRGMVRLWAGLLAENVTQAVARDILADALVRCDDAGIPVVGHVHDEVIAEGEYPSLRDVMCDLPPWADGLPIDAESSIVERYTK